MTQTAKLVIQVLETKNENLDLSYGPLTYMYSSLTVAYVRVWVRSTDSKKTWVLRYTDILARSFSIFIQISF